MLTINIQLDNLVYKDIAKENLRAVLDLYNQNGENIYATGIDRQMSLRDIKEKYLEVLVNSHEFFTGIFLRQCNNDAEGLKMVGVVKGRIDYENIEEAWISSIIIDSRYQRKGIGRKTVDTLINILNQTYDVKRIFIGIISCNDIGKYFWQRMGFDYYRTIEHYIRLNNHAEDFVIMKKEIIKK